MFFPRLTKQAELWGDTDPPVEGLIRSPKNTTRSRIILFDASVVFLDGMEAESPGSCGRPRGGEGPVRTPPAPAALPVGTGPASAYLQAIFNGLVVTRTAKASRNDTK